jgi:hypothetical protein
MIKRFIDGARKVGGSVGGNPISATQNIAAYFFLNNIDGWRIRPPEENGETVLNGNLFPLDPSLPYILPTVGGFTQLLKLVVSPQSLVTVAEGGGLTSLQDTRLQQIHAQVEREIYVDTSIGSPDGDGSQQQPYNSFAQAADAAETLGIRSIAILGDSTLDRPLAKFKFRGEGNPTVNLNSQNVNQSIFRNCVLQGDQNGTIEADDCELSNNMTGLSGLYRRCGLNGSLTCGTSARVIMADPFSNIPGLGRPDIDVNGGNTKLALRRYAGGMTISGMSNANNEVTIELSGGKVTLDASNNAGTFSLRGVGQFTRLSTGTLVDQTGFVSGEDIRLIKALVGGDAVVSLDDQTITVYDDTISPRQVLAVYSISADGRVRTRTA